MTRASQQPAAGTPQKIATQASPQATKLGAGLLAWPALLRKLDRIDPSFREQIAVSGRRGAAS